MLFPTENLIVGLGLAGSAAAWTLIRDGQSVIVVDAGHANSASRVAAGLITPVTGRRLVRSPGYESEWKTAVEFYRWVEDRTGTEFFEERPMIRLFADKQAREHYLQQSRDFQLAEWNGPVQAGGPEQHGVVMAQAGRLDVCRYLQATQNWLKNEGRFFRSAFHQKDWQPEQILTLDSQRIRARRLILATGAETHPHFPEVPNHPTRGDVLTVRIPEYLCDQVVHRSIWIVPHRDGTQTVGSTYDWSNPDPHPSAAGRQEILKKLNRIVDGDVDVIDHKAGVRPTMKDYRPVVGRHPELPGIFVLNGLGSRGALRAPHVAQRLLAATNGQNPGQEIDYARLLNRPRRNRSLTQLAQEKVREVVRAGDTTVDATVGNGFDTCFLAQASQPGGSVMGFDIQQQAIESTSQRLAANGLHSVTLKQTSHENLMSFVTSGSVAAVMFNLGYLPRGDHAVTTLAHSTVAAVESAVDALQHGGIMTVLCYRGHEGGKEEFQAVERLLTGYADRYDLERIDSDPPKATSPVLFVLRK